MRVPLYYITTGEWREAKVTWEIICTIIGSAREPALYSIIMYIREMDGRSGGMHIRKRGLPC